MSSDIMDATSLAGRYATALFELADEQKELDQVAEDMVNLNSVLSKSEDLRLLIRSPIISRNDQQKVMHNILTEVGIGQLSRNFIGVIVNNRRLFSLPAMIKGYLALLARARGEAEIFVISARPLSDSQQENIMKALKEVVGAKVSLDASVDKSLLGGLILKIGSRMFDSSLRTKLIQLRLAMKGVG